MPEDKNNESEQKTVHCKMCKAPFQIDADQEVHVLGMTCGEKCEEDYQELCRDGHWN